MGFSFISGVEILFYCLLVKVYQIWEPRNTKQKRHEKEKKKIKKKIKDKEKNSTDELCVAWGPDPK